MVMLVSVGTLDTICAIGLFVTLYFTRRYLNRRELLIAQKIEADNKAAFDYKNKLSERYWVFKSFLAYCQVERNFVHNFYEQRNLKNSIANLSILKEYCMNTEPSDLVKNAFNISETREGAAIWNNLSDYWVQCDKDKKFSGTAPENIKSRFRVTYYAY